MATVQEAVDEVKEEAVPVLNSRMKKAHIFVCAIGVIVAAVIGYAVVKNIISKK